MEDLNQVDQQIFLLTDALEKGDYSSPNMYVNIYDRKQGIRIVRLMNRTEPHIANLKEDYALIKRAAENDKKQRLINNWVKAKISNAYIRIDDEYRNCNFSNNNQMLLTHLYRQALKPFLRCQAFSPKTNIV